MTTTVAAPITPLTRAQKRVATHLVCGLTNPEIAGEEHLSGDTVSSHVRVMRESLHCPPRSSRAVLAHALLSHQQVPPPPPSLLRRAFEPDADDQLLIRAIAEHSRPDDIARAARIPAGELRTRTDGLVRRAGASNAAHLIGLAHTHAILGGEGSTAAEQPPAQPAGAAR
ncbi:LuxR C-terminal-related transcriptional regulator (plasmid) [Streptomyces sp. NBC_01216]|uniref:LuxR C-terminal-related transcriptional regulator n=1 Tax=Streptomyces sp. NBC_01216 TaxID=2903778 RepID=UPI002E12D884|nr:LuxR C-terminal-related transcriptional regulator [Streptomyces sp. NBC_01216]